MKIFIVGRLRQPLSAPSQAASLTRDVGPGANPGIVAVLPTKDKPLSLSGGARLAVWAGGEGANLGCGQCPHFGPLNGPYRGWIGPDSACFQDFPVIERVGRLRWWKLGPTFRDKMPEAVSLVLPQLPPSNSPPRRRRGAGAPAALRLERKAHELSGSLPGTAVSAVPYVGPGVMRGGVEGTHNDIDIVRLGGLVRGGHRGLIHPRDRDGPRAQAAWTPRSR